MKKDCRAWKKKQDEQANVVSDGCNHDEVSLMVMESGTMSSPVRDLVLRSFPNASEDEIINWGAAIKDEIFNLKSMGTWKAANEEDAALIRTDVSNQVECCCDWSCNFYNVLCCRSKNDDDSSSHYDMEDQDDIFDDTVDMHEVGMMNQSIDDAANLAANDEIEISTAAFEIWSSSIEEAFHQAAHVFHSHDHVPENLEEFALKRFGEKVHLYRSSY